MNGSPPFRPLDEECVDRFLAHRVHGAPLAHIDALGPLGQQREDFRRDQVVVERDMRALDELQRPQCKEVGVARTRTHEEDLALRCGTRHANLRHAVPPVPVSPKG
jgi:hypothetical protein